jgi:Coenzyme PQQ synthesis protein D (PqqD)
MSEQLYVTRSKRVAARMLGDEMMVMSARDSTLFTLNPVASIIWNAADGRTTLGEIVATRVCPEFDVEPEEALRDAKLFAQELAEHGILTLSQEPNAQSEAQVPR